MARSAFDPAAAAARRDRRRQRGRLLASNPAWPVTALLIGYPLWWALGIADFMWVILAIPMLVRIGIWLARGTRRVRVPPAFGIWLLFLIVASVGLATLTLTAPGTVPSPVSHRLLAFANRQSDYLGVTVLLLYAGNLTERELPRRRLAWMLGLVAAVTVAGGLAGMVAPHLQFNSPFVLLLPAHIRMNPFIQASMHPGLSQVQNVLGSAAGRPKAPFDYTNIWGDCLSILLPFLVVGWWNGGSRRLRLIAAGLIGISVVPLLYSLNRGVWIGVGLSVVYLAVRLARRGQTALLVGLCGGAMLVAVLLLGTPLKGVITGRLENGKSNNLRSNLSSLAVQAARASPLIGYGDTRQERGSPRSIAVGPSLKCPICGQLEVGSTGQLWLLLVCSGFLGAALYLGFFGYGVWRYRHDVSPYGMAGVLVLLLSFVYMSFYDATGAPLGFTMLAYALMWKNDLYQRGLDSDRAVPAAPGRPGSLPDLAREPAVPVRTA